MFTQYAQNPDYTIHICLNCISRSERVCVGLQETSYVPYITKPVVVFYIHIIYILPRTMVRLLRSYYLHFTPLVGGKASTSACSVVVWGQTTSMRRQSLSFDMVRHAITRFPSLPAPLTLAKQRNKPHARRFHIFHR